MITNLISYNGLDNMFEYETRWNFTQKIEGIVYSDTDIEYILSFSLDKECTSHKIINIFEETNLDCENFFGNLLVINNKLELIFEYGNHQNFSTLNIVSKTIYKSAFKSLQDFMFPDVDIIILTKDLFCEKLNNHEIYYCINLLVCINEM